MAKRNLAVMHGRMKECGLVNSDEPDDDSELEEETADDRTFISKVIFITIDDHVKHS